MESKWMRVVIAALVIGVVKVGNELVMTYNYHAQASAQERSAVALERIADGGASEFFAHHPHGESKPTPRELTAKENGDLWTTCNDGTRGQIRDCVAAELKTAAATHDPLNLCYKNGFASPPEVCR